MSKTYDAIIIGAGIIGLSLGLELREHGLSVVVLERREPGREASWAAAGMLAAQDPHTPAALREMALWSAELYPAFIRYLEELSGASTGFSQSGAIYVSEHPRDDWRENRLSPSALTQLEPALVSTVGYIYELEEASVDPRALLVTLLSSCKRMGVEVRHEHPVQSVLTTAGRATGVQTSSQSFVGAVVVNCAGAWAGELPEGAPVVPVKGQMLSVLPSAKPGVTHTIRSDQAYMLPRPDGHVVIGATLERVGFDKRVETQVIQRLLQLATSLVPSLGEARIVETWAGLRPGTPDDLPILGRAISLENYYLCTGHYRDGILLAPATAKVMAQLIRGTTADLDLAAFSPARFAPAQP